MPIYAYRCEACGQEHDALQKISAPPLTDCPACGEPRLKKQLSAAVFRLKGGGWYETDFKGGSKRNLHETGDKPKNGSDGQTEKGKARTGSTDGGKEAAKPTTGGKPSSKAA